MAHAVNPNIEIGDLSHVYDINYLYGFFIAFFLYAALNYLFPVPETFVEKTIHGEVEYYEGAGSDLGIDKQADCEKAGESKVVVL